jgi:hypothetical protein
MKRKVDYALRVLMIFVFYLLIQPRICSNNLNIYNFHVVQKNSVENWVMLEFDLSVENSWRITSDAANWNAVWVFVKYQVNNGGWHHVTLSNIDSSHKMPFEISADAVADGKGIFIYPSQENAGLSANYAGTGLQIRWNYSADGIQDNETGIELRIFGIEMVYIPQGAYYIGSGGSDINTFYQYPDISTPFLIGSENPIIVGTSSGNLCYSQDNSFCGDLGGPIALQFPKGYKGFYAMRYEISQQQYMDFLNCLTRSQQGSRVESDISASTVSNVYVMSATASMSYRNSIRSLSSGIGTSEPIHFFCDYNQNGIGNEPGDGQEIACNFISWNDGLAYLDWAGLRPMTELEFEKACRGTANPLPFEYAWGTNVYTSVDGSIANAGFPNEQALVSGEGLSNILIGDGPLRCGFAATNSTNRLQSASGFYGIANLSDNLSERAVSIGSPSGRAFIGQNGDGELAANGDTDIGWPDVEGQSVRGGNFIRGQERMDVSCRYVGTLNDAGRYFHRGWRGARTVE